MESRSYQADGERWLSEMENIFLIKVFSLYLKKTVFNLYEKIGNYFWDNPIAETSTKFLMLSAITIVTWTLGVGRRILYK